jgi:invasion protein IalB
MIGVKTGTTSAWPTEALWALMTTATLSFAGNSAADTIIPPSVQQLTAGPQHLVFSPWTKVCPDQGPDETRTTCFIGKNGRTDTGASFVAAVLIDTGHDAEKMLRVTLPLGVRLGEGTWISVDQSLRMSAPFVTCVPLGCFADYQANNELIAGLRQGKELMIHAVNGDGQVARFALPLFDFSEAYDGPPTEQ